MAHRRLRHLVVVVGLIASTAGSAWAFSTGITTGSFGSGGCNECHGGGTAPMVSVSGPSTVAPGSTQTYTLTVTNPGAQLRAGLNVSATGGTLASGGPDTQVLSGQITHVSPKLSSGGVTTFSFDWTAPMSFSSLQLRAWGNAVNFNGGSDGDRAASHFFNIVAPTATPTPTATMTPSPTPPPTLCAATPRSCDVPGKSSLAVTNQSDDKKDAVVFKWSKGATTNIGDFGDPTSSAHYSLCLYQDGIFHAELSAPAADTCNGKPCWAGNTKAIKYKDKLGTPHGITLIGLVAGAVPGKAKIQVKAKGFNIPDPGSISIGVAVAAQVVNSENDNCWGAVWTTGEIKNDGVKLKAKSSN